MFPGLTELLLIGCSIELIWTPKSKSNTWTPKTNSQTFLTKGNFTRDEWNHLLCFFNISHFSSTVCSDTMAKRSQQSTRFRRKASHSKIATYDESYCQDAVVRIVLNFSKPVEETSRKSRSMRDQLLEKTDRGDPIKAQIYLKPPINTTMSNSWKASLQQVIQNLMTTVLGILKSGKLRLRRTIDQGDLIKLLGEW